MDALHLRTDDISSITVLSLLSKVHAEPSESEESDESSHFDWGKREPEEKGV